MRRFLFAMMIVTTVGTAVSGVIWPEAPVAAFQGAASADRPAWRFEKIADGVHFATGTGVLTTMSNSMVIVNSDHVMLVDTSVTPVAAQALVDQIRREISDRPIRYVFNSHYHFDHAHGNQIFGPDVTIIGHEFIRRMHQSNVLQQRTNRLFTANLPNQIEQMRQRIAQTTDPAERGKLQASLGVTEAHYRGVQQTVVTPPNVTFTDSLTLHKGGREVQLHFFGRGHTGGDTMVYLPAERIIFTGDFFEGRPGGGVLSFLGDGFIDEWPGSLERMKALDFETIVPGHGAPLKEREQIDAFQAYLRDLWRQASTLRQQGVSAEEAVKRIDLGRHTALYGDRARNPDIRAVTRVYELLQIQMPM
jgi:glyoxylase-like metal-dependent hydrolase (beta-lactamase superfamily II)